MIFDKLEQHVYHSLQENLPMDMFQYCPMPYLGNVDDIFCIHIDPQAECWVKKKHGYAVMKEVDGKSFHGLNHSHDVLMGHYMTIEPRSQTWSELHEQLLPLPHSSSSPILAWWIETVYPKKDIQLICHTTNDRLTYHNCDLESLVIRVDDDLVPPVQFRVIGAVFDNMRHIKQSLADQVLQNIIFQSEIMSIPLSSSCMDEEPIEFVTYPESAYVSE